MIKVFDLSDLDDSSRKTWSQWKDELLPTIGLKVTKDSTGIQPGYFLSRREVQTKCLIKCEIELMEGWEEGEPGVAEEDKLLSGETELEPASMIPEMIEVQTPERELTIPEWVEQYNHLSNNLPKEGDYIKTIDGSKIRINVELTNGKPPFMSTRIYVPKVVGSRLGWFAQSEHDEYSFGWLAILVPQARDEAMKRKGIEMENGRPKPFSVSILQAVRHSLSGHSLLVRVEEW